MRTPLRIALTALFLAFLQVASAWACSVCYGAAESPVIRGAELSILFMIVVTYLTVGGGVVGFLLLLRRRRKMLEEGHEAGA